MADVAGRVRRLDLVSRSGFPTSSRAGSSWPGALLRLVGSGTGARLVPGGSSWSASGIARPRSSETGYSQSAGHRGGQFWVVRLGTAPRLKLEIAAVAVVPD